MAPDIDPQHLLQALQEQPAFRKAQAERPHITRRCVEGIQEDLGISAKTPA